MSFAACKAGKQERCPALSFHLPCSYNLVSKECVCAVNLSCDFVLKMAHFLETAQWN